MAFSTARRVSLPWGADEVAEGVAHPGEEPAAPLKGDEGVLEGGGGGVARDGGDLGELLGHAAVQGRGEMAVLDPIKGRVAERQRARLEERVGRGGGRGGGKHGEEEQAGQGRAEEGHGRFGENYGSRARSRKDPAGVEGRSLRGR
jgi:hypothetical protein